jgi:hypothetical protein
MANLNTASPGESAAAIAERWYMDLLRREVAAKGPPEAAEHVSHFISTSLEVGTPDQFGTPLRLALWQSVSECSVRLNRVNGELISWYLDFLAKEGDTSMPKDEALKLATATASPPQQAKLVEADYETMADRTFFRARWDHFEDKVQVDGDYIEVLVNGRFRKAFALSCVWRSPNLTDVPAER